MCWSLRPRLTDPEVLETVRELAFDLELNEYAVGTMSPFTLRKPDGNGGTAPAVPEGMQDFAEVALALTDLQQNDPMMRNLITPDLPGVVIIMFPNPELTRATARGRDDRQPRANTLPHIRAKISRWS